jgi:Phage-related minor tail protein.
MQTVSKDARGTVKELTGAYVQLGVEYSKLSQSEKEAASGKALAQSLDEIRQRAVEARNELRRVESELDDVSTKTKGFGSGIGRLFNGIAGQFGISTSMLTGIGAAAGAFKVIGDNVNTAMGFEQSIHGLSALTGKTGEELETLKNYAIELGGTTTLTASEVADAFRLIGSQQPQLLSSSEALRDVTKEAIKLAEAAGIDLATASQTLSTSINQMGGDSNNAKRYVNVLAAASQQGAGDIAWLGESITKADNCRKGCRHRL